MTILAIIIAILAVILGSMFFAEAGGAAGAATADPQGSGEGEGQGEGEGEGNDELLAGKYKTESDLDKGIGELDEKIDTSQFSLQQKVQMYKALERRQGRQQQQGQQQTGQQQQGQQQQQQKQGQQGDLTISEGEGEGEQPQQIESVDQAVEAAGLDMQTLAQQMQSSGDLTEEQYQALENATKFSRGFIQDMARSKMAEAQVQQQQVEQIQQTAYELVGGQEPYQNLMQFAKQNLTAEEQQWFNNQVSGQNITKAGVEAAVTWLKNKHQQAVGAGNSQPLVTGDGTASGATGTIETRQEYFAVLNRAKRGDEQAQAQLRAHRQNGGKRFH